MSVFSQNNNKTNTSGSDIEGFKIWSWKDLEAEINGTSRLASFNNSTLNKSVDYYAPSAYVKGKRLHFRLNPTIASPQGQTHAYNFRSEIRSNPSGVDHAIGTEEWWGFDYRFEEGYIPDVVPWIMFQTHGSFSVPSNPMTSIWVVEEGFNGDTGNEGEIYVTNAAFNTASAKYTRTGVFSSEGKTLSVVIKIVWGDNTNGEYKVWINGVNVYDEQERTVFVEQPIGGYWKAGIYKWRWQIAANVVASAVLGIDNLHVSIGDMRQIMYLPNSTNKTGDEFHKVSPR